MECAVRIQKDSKEKNASLPEKRRTVFHIGVNPGDVIDDEGSNYGDGVNVAERVEGLVEGVGICISRLSIGPPAQDEFRKGKVPDFTLINRHQK